MFQTVTRENHSTRRFGDAGNSNRLVIRLAVFSLVIWGFFSAPAMAASTIYNMDNLLNQPHPFATRTVRPPISSPAPAAPSVQPTARPVSAPRQPAAPLPDSAPAMEMDDMPKGDGEEDVNDPLESVNRAVFDFNEVLVKFLLGPLARGYNAVLPNPAREAISSFLDNLKEPVVLANDLLQGEWKRGYHVSMRILINTTVGLVGFIDVAEKFGYEKHKEDFGQTLAVWGIGEGFYLVLPLLGPSNPRDALGRVADNYLDPLGYYLRNTDREYISYALTGARGVVTYASLVDQIDDLRDTSIDFYGAIRSLYRQRRLSEITNGGVNGNSNSDPGLDGDLDEMK